MRTTLWILAAMVLLSGCTDDTDDPSDEPGTQPDTDTAQPGGDPGMEEPAPEEESFSPVYINGTLSQNLADCSDPADVAAGGSNHDLPEGAGGRSYEVSIASAGDLPTESICVSFDGASASTSGTVPDDAGTITIGGDFAVGTAYSIYIS